MAVNIFPTQATIDSNLYRVPTISAAQVTYKETPRQSDADALLLANGWPEDSTIELVTPKSKVWTFQINNDPDNPGTLITSTITNISGNYYATKSNTLAADFVPNSIVYFYADSDFPGPHISNNAGDTWIQMESGARSVVNDQLIDTGPVHIYPDEATRDAATDLYQFMDAWSILENSREELTSRGPDVWTPTTDTWDMCRRYVWSADHFADETEVLTFLNNVPVEGGIVFRAQDVGL